MGTDWYWGREPCGSEPGGGHPVQKRKRTVGWSTIMKPSGSTATLRRCVASPAGSIHMQCPFVPEPSVQQCLQYTHAGAKVLHDQQWYTRCEDHLLRHAPEQDCRRATAAASGHDDGIHVVLLGHSFYDVDYARPLLEKRCHSNTAAVNRRDELPVRLFFLAAEHQIVFLIGDGRLVEVDVKSQAFGVAVATGDAGGHTEGCRPQVPKSRWGRADAAIWGSPPPARATPNTAPSLPGVGPMSYGLLIQAGRLTRRGQPASLRCGSAIDRRVVRPGPRRTLARRSALRQSVAPRRPAASVAILRSPTLVAHLPSWATRAQSSLFRQSPGGRPLPRRRSRLHRWGSWQVLP